jgi:hypothetical protein
VGSALASDAAVPLFATYVSEDGATLHWTPDATCTAGGGLSVPGIEYLVAGVWHTTGGGSAVSGHPEQIDLFFAGYGTPTAIRIASVGEVGMTSTHGIQRPYYLPL